MVMPPLARETNSTSRNSIARPARRISGRGALLWASAVVICGSAAVAWWYQSRLQQAEALNARGLELHELGKYGEAIEAYSKAVRLDPNLAQAYNNRAASHHARGNSDRALDDYARALELDPKAAVIWYNRGCTFDDLHRFNRALADYNEAIRLDPHYADAWHNRGMTLRVKGHLERANADLARAKELRKGGPRLKGTPRTNPSGPVIPRP